VTGGGSGGHITPILAVASELKRLRPEVRIVYIGQKGESLLDIPAQDPSIDEVRVVRAGKFRRYHGEGWRQVFNLATQARNVRDAFFVLIGIWQSFWLLRRLKPSVIFTRGGFVSVPVALAGVLRRVPYITHDSDSVPSLANRLIARWAHVHAVALPPETYPYPPDKTVMVGIPLSDKYQPVTPRLQAQYRHELELDEFEQVVLVTGGGNGARKLNAAILENAVRLLKHYPKLCLLHVSGRALEAELRRNYDGLLAPEDTGRVRVIGFAPDFYRYSGAADVIVARGGATNLAEFAVQAKACIIVPATRLVGDHQTKNAQVLVKKHAIVTLSEDQAEQDGRLARAIAELLGNTRERQQLRQNLAQFARTDAAERLAMLLLDEANFKNKPASS